MKRIDVAIAVVCRGQKLLICRRKSGGHLAGYWEFPGGKVEAQESAAQCLSRELREELNIECEILTPLPTIEHDYPDRAIRLHPFLCAHKKGDPEAIGCESTQWVRPEDLRSFKFPPANDTLIEEILDHFKQRSGAASENETQV